MFITQFVFINPKVNEIINIIKNTQLEYIQEYGCNYHTNVNIKRNVKFIDKVENKTKNILIGHENVIGKVNKIKQSFKGMFNFNRVLKLTIVIEGKIQKNIVNVYSKCDIIPIIWKKH